MRKLLKKLGRPLLRVPVLGRLLRVLQAMWRGPVNAARLDQIEGRTALLSGALDSVLDNITDVVSREREMDADRDNLVGQPGRATAWLDVERKVEDLGRSVESLRERVEVVRAEVLLELRYRHHTESEPAEPAQAKVKIDLSASTEPLRVNLGCGHAPLPGYVNVDDRDLPGVDVVANPYALPFEAGTVLEFFSSHFLEHFPLEEFRRQLLPVLRAKLAPGGTLRAVLCDVDAMMRAYTAGNRSYDDLREVIYGGQTYDRDFRYNVFTPASITELLTAGGFSAVKVIEAARVNGKSLEFEIEATRV